GDDVAAELRQNAGELLDVGVELVALLDARGAENRDAVVVLVGGADLRQAVGDRPQAAERGFDDLGGLRVVAHDGVVVFDGGARVAHVMLLVEGGPTEASFSSTMRSATR